jgi:hypothetical protein
MPRRVLSGSEESDFEEDVYEASDAASDTADEKYQDDEVVLDDDAASSDSPDLEDDSDSENIKSNTAKKRKSTGGAKPTGKKGAENGGAGGGRKQPIGSKKTTPTKASLAAPKKSLVTLTSINLRSTPQKTTLSKRATSMSATRATSHPSQGIANNLPAVAKSPVPLRVGLSRRAMSNELLHNPH